MTTHGGYGRQAWQAGRECLGNTAGRNAAVGLLGKLPPCLSHPVLFLKSCEKRHAQSKKAKIFALFKKCKSPKTVWEEREG